MLDDALEGGFGFELLVGQVRIIEWLLFHEIVVDVVEFSVSVEFVALVAGGDFAFAGLHVAVIPAIDEFARVARLAVELWQEAATVEGELFGAALRNLAECRQEIAEVDQVVVHFGWNRSGARNDEWHVGAAVGQAAFPSGEGLAIEHRNHGVIGAVVAGENEIGVFEQALTVEFCFDFANEVIDILTMSPKYSLLPL